MQLASVPVPPPPAQTVAGDELERLLGVWKAATPEEKAEMVKMVFDAVYVDTKAKEIVAYRPKESYKVLFSLGEGLREEAGLLVTERYAELAVLATRRRVERYREHGNLVLVAA